MPTKNENITLGPGTVYINGDELGNISEANCTVEPDEFVDMVNGMTKLYIATKEASLSFKMATSVFTRFAHVITGIDKHLRETCPNRRVVHLAYHAHKLRTRKKNYRRMIRICEKNDRSNA